MGEGLDRKERQKRYSVFTKKLEKELKYSRYLHTLGVAFTATSMAMVHGADIEKAETAGLLHDCAKCLGDKESIRLCEKEHIEVTQMERRNPSLLHAKAGVAVAREEYGITDEEILGAIRWHTTGKPGMTKLEKIIFIADYIEPGRCEAPGLPGIRRLAFQDLDACMLQILSDTLQYLKETGKEIDSATEETRAYYAELIKSRR